MSNDAPPDRAHRHSYKSESYINLMRVLGIAAKICVLLAVTVTALYFQIANRPKLPNIYHTNDPTDTVRKGETYTCGCSLPATIQSPDNPSENTNTSIYRCYEASELETVRVLMFPKKTTGATLQPALDALGPEEVYYNDLPDGFSIGQEAYDLSGVVTDDPLQDEIKSLFLNEKRQNDTRSSMPYLRGDEFISFPRSFLRVRFAYNCTDCTTCALELVNNIITEVSNDEKWASCFYWGYLGDACGKDNAYEAKCLLYPTKSLPPNFAIRGFFEHFSNLAGINQIDPPSLQPSSLYLNISQIENSSISMGFVEVVRASAFWISVSNLFPAMDTSCSNMSKVRVCHGTSVCNVFTTNKLTTNYQTKCMDLVDRDKCLNLMKDSSPDNVRFIRDGWDNWDNINCGLPNQHPRCFNIMPYFAEWNISQRMAQDVDSLNQFLYDNMLQDEWAQRTGVCTNTFKNVIRYSPKNTQDGSASGNELGRDGHTVYLQSECTSTAFGRDYCFNCTSTTLRRDYCWLTGRYHKINDGPDKNGSLQWKNLSELFPDAPRSPIFACYRVDQQSIVTWLIVSFGVVFGWIGTVHMIFKFSWWVIQKVARRVNGHTFCLQWRSFRPKTETSSTLGSGSQSDLWSDSYQASSPFELRVSVRSSSLTMRGPKSPHE